MDHINAQLLSEIQTVLFFPPGHPNISHTLLFHLQTRSRTAHWQRHFERVQERSDTPTVLIVIDVKQQWRKLCWGNFFFFGYFFHFKHWAKSSSLFVCVCVFWTTLFITHLLQCRSCVFCVFSLKAVILWWVLLTHRLQIPRRQYLIPKGDL